MEPIDLPEPQFATRRFDRPLRPAPRAFALGFIAGALLMSQVVAFVEYARRPTAWDNVLAQR